MLGELLKNSTVSGYQPSQDVIDVTKIVKRDYSDGWDILHKSYVELNNYSPIERASKDQRTFNSFVDESVEDPNEAWKWRGTRGLARNKAMAMHAHLTAEYIIPAAIAQNDKQQEDRDAGELMHDLMEWTSVNSNYRPAFLMATQGMLVNPVTYLEADFCEVYQTVKERTAEGYEMKKILDDVLSGFSANVLTLDQVFITNVYEPNIQRQRAISKVRYIDYKEAEAKYKDHPHWTYLSPGIINVFNEEDGMFYETYDDEHQTLIQEVTWYNRREDGEVCYLNGIYFGHENIEFNPIKHRDNRNAPKYNKTPFGYERVNEHFFFFKSLINRVGWDDQLIDAMYEMQMNSDFLDLEMPVAITGIDNLDSSVMFPGAQIASANKDFDIKPIRQRGNGAGYRAIQEIEKSAAEATLSDTESGQLPDGDVKATAINRAAQNAKILLSGARKNLAESIRQYGDLMKDIVLQHLTIPHVDQISGNLKYPNFLLADQMVGGKKVSKRILFDESLLGYSMSEDKRNEKSIKMLDEVGYPNNKEHLYRVNPYLFSRLKYLIRVEAEAMEPKNKEFRQAIAERMYSLFRNEPLIASQPEAFVRKVMEPFFGGEVDDIIPAQVMGTNPIDMTQQQNGQKSPPVLPSMPKDIQYQRS